MVRLKRASAQGENCMMLFVPSDEHGMPRITGFVPTTPVTESQDGSLSRAASEVSIADSVVSIVRNLFG